MRCVGFITTLLRGTEWAATGKVTIPVPDDFPTAEKISSRKKSSLMHPQQGHVVMRQLFIQFATLLVAVPSLASAQDVIKPGMKLSEVRSILKRHHYKCADEYA